MARAGAAPDSGLRFPLVSKSGTNQLGKRVHYYLNYSADPAELTYANKDGVSLLPGTPARRGDTLKLAPWDVAIIEEQ